MLSSCRGCDARQAVVREIDEYDPNKRCRYGYGYDGYDGEDEDEDEDEEGIQNDCGKQQKNDDQVSSGVLTCIYDQPAVSCGC